MKTYYLIFATDRRETWYEPYIISKLFKSADDADFAKTLYELHYKEVKVLARDVK